MLTQFQKHQIEKYLDSQGIKKHSSSLQDYELAKKLLFPWGRPDPVNDLDYGDGCRYVANYLKV
jgi:hypothetical protein